MIEHTSSTVPLKKSLVCLHIDTSLQLAPLRSAYRHRSVVSRSTRCSTLLVNQLSITLIITLIIKIGMCFTQTWVHNLALLPTKHSPHSLGWWCSVLPSCCWCCFLPSSFLGDAPSILGGKWCLDIQMSLERFPHRAPTHTHTSSASRAHQMSTIQIAHGTRSDMPLHDAMARFRFCAPGTRRLERTHR